MRDDDRCLEEGDRVLLDGRPATLGEFVDSIDLPYVVVHLDAGGTHGILLPDHGIRIQRFPTSPTKEPGPMNTQDKRKLIASLLDDYDHAFLSREGVLHFTRPFGFDGETQTYAASPDEPKGLTLANGMPSADGLPAEDIARQICQHLKLEYPAMMGRGFALRACCHVIDRHLAQLEAQEGASPGEELKPAGGDNVPE